MHPAQSALRRPACTTGEGALRGRGTVPFIYHPTGTRILASLTRTRLVSFSFFLFFHLVPRRSRGAHDVPVVGTSRLCLSLPQYASQRAIGLVASPTLPIFPRLLAPVILHSPRTPCTPRPSASGKPTQWIPDVVQRCGRGLGGSPMRGGAGGDGIRRPGTAAYRRAVERPISPTTILCANHPPHWYCLSATMSTGVGGGLQPPGAGLRRLPERAGWRDARRRPGSGADARGLEWAASAGGPSPQPPSLLLYQHNVHQRWSGWVVGAIWHARTPDGLPPFFGHHNMIRGP